MYLHYGQNAIYCFSNVFSLLWCLVILWRLQTVLELSLNLELSLKLHLSDFTVQKCSKTLLPMLLWLYSREDLYYDEFYYLVYKLYCMKECHTLQEEPISCFLIKLQEKQCKFVLHWARIIHMHLNHLIWLLKV